MKNENTWFHFYFRIWLEDERVMRMSMAAQGLYIRALCYQARHGSLPSDRAELALLLMAPNECEDTWNSVFSHFKTETIDDEERWYNNRLREILVTRQNVIKTKSENRKNGTTTPVKRPKKGRSTDALPRASNSNSISLSNSLEDIFNIFWKLYPRGEGKAKAKEWFKNNKPSAELAQQINDHVSKRIVSDPDWLKEGGKFIPHATTFLNQSKWEDDYAKRSRIVPREQPNDGMANFQDLDPDGWDAA